MQFPVFAFWVGTVEYEIIVGNARVGSSVEIFYKSCRCKGKFCSTGFDTSAVRRYDEYFVLIFVFFKTVIAGAMPPPLLCEIYAFYFILIQGAHARIKIRSFRHNSSPPNEVRDDRITIPIPAFREKISRQ